MPKMAPHTLVLIDGQTFTGEAKPKRFKVTGPDGTFNVPADRISRIHFEKGNPSGIDELVLRSTSIIRGHVHPDPVPFKLADTGETRSFPHRRIHTLVMF